MNDILEEIRRLEERRDKLLAMKEMWDNGELDFTPNVSRDFFDKYLEILTDHLNTLTTNAIEYGVIKI